MSDRRKTEDDHLTETRERVLATALPHVSFDGWSDKVLRAAVAEAGVDAGLARLAFARGGVDLALYFHEVQDMRMITALSEAPLQAMKVRAKIVFGIRTRLDLVAPHRDAVRRAVALFALPPYAADAARALWGTADAIWRATGDQSTDYNWYTKRATLSGVYGAVALYWLGDESEGAAETWRFLDDRIGDVMRIEKAKAALRKNPLTRLMLRGPSRILAHVRSPGAKPPNRAEGARAMPMPGRTPA